MVSAGLVTLVSPFYISLLSTPTTHPDYHLLAWIGLCDPASAIIPLALVMILFVGE